MKLRRIRYIYITALAIFFLTAFSHDVYAGQIRIFLTATTTTTWTVPSDWNNTNNTIEVIGGGGSGGYSEGGGGGGYSKVSNVTLAPGSTVTIQVGDGGKTTFLGSGGTDTYFCNSTSNCASIAGSAVVVGAKAGGASVGGSSSSGVGTVKYSGGNGGTGAGGGSGGAAGPNGNGGNGGAGGVNNTSSAGGGGGGGGSNGIAAPGGNNGAAGGNNYLGTGSGAGGGFTNPGVSGTNGGGGGGSGYAGGGSGNGGNGTEWDLTHGSGGGGGGLQESTGYAGAGGLYGAGGTGVNYNGYGADGAQGIIVITYLVKSTLFKPTNTLGLVGYWSFNEGTSTIAHDFSGAANHGTLTNISNPPTGTSGWTTVGKAGNALNFDGTNDTVVPGALYGSTTKTGLLAYAYTGMSFNTFVGNFVDQTIDFNPADTVLGTNRVGVADIFSYRWTGYVKADYSETYTFYTQSDDGVRLYVNGNTIVDNWTDHAPVQNSGTIALTAGIWYPITLEFYENGGGAVIQLQWSSTGVGAQQIIPASKLITSLEFAKSISFWVKPNSIANQGLMTVGTSSSIGTNGSGDISATGFTSPTYYVNGVQTGSPKLVANQWNLITVTTSTAIPVTNVSFGTDGTNFTNGTIDDVKIFSRILSTTEISGFYVNPKNVRVGGNETGRVTSGLIGYWPLNGKDISWSSGTAGVAYDRSGRGNTGTMIGMNQATSTVQGKIGQALTFPGSYTSYIDYGSTLHSSISGALTLSAWVYRVAGSQEYSNIFADENYGNNEGYYLGDMTSSGPDDVYGCRLNGASGNSTVTYESSITYNQWTHYACVFDGDLSYLYKNGVLVDTDDPSFSTLSPNSGSGGVGAGLNGRIDDARIYNRVLSATEIKQLYNLGKVTTRQSI